MKKTIIALVLILVCALFWKNAIVAAVLALATPAPPASIEFGTSYSESAGTGLVVAINDPRTRFTKGALLVWVARLQRPAGTTRPDIMLTQVTPTGAESVLDRQPMNLADPKYNVISGSVVTIDKGHYRLKVLNGDVVLATGDFTVDSLIRDLIMDKTDLYDEADIAEVGTMLDTGACDGRGPHARCGYWFTQRVELGRDAGPAYIVSCSGNHACNNTNLIVRKAGRWMVLAATFGDVSVGPPIVNGRATITVEGGKSDDGAGSFTWNGSRYVAKD